MLAARGRGIRIEISPFLGSECWRHDVTDDRDPAGKEAEYVVSLFGGRGYFSQFGNTDGTLTVFLNFPCVLPNAFSRAIVDNFGFLRGNHSKHNEPDSAVVHRHAISGSHFYLNRPRRIEGIMSLV